MARLFRSRSGSYGVDFVDASGRRVRRIVGSSKREASAILARLTAEAAEGRLGLRSSSRATLGDLWPLWEADRLRLGRRDLRHDRARWARLVAILGARLPLGAVGQPHVERVRRELAALAPGGRNRYLALLRAMLALGQRQGLIAVAPHVGLEPEGPPRDRIWTAEELAAATAPDVPDRARLAILLMRWSGLRLSEACGLRWERDIHLEASPPYLRAPPVAKTKKSAGRPIPLRWGGPLHRALADAQRPSGPVLAGPGGKAWAPETAASNLARLRSRLGIDATCHDLRHTYLTEIAATGADLGLVADLAGHSSLQTTRRYVHRSASDLASALGYRDAPRAPESDSAKIPDSEEGALRPNQEGGAH